METSVIEPEKEAVYRDSAAAKMLSEGLAVAATERGLSQRTVAKRLGYKQSVVLSHMALGRVPIPIDRAQQLADVLMLDERAFLTSVLQQRHPSIDWKSLLCCSDFPERAYGLVSELEAILDGPLERLSSGQAAVIREVAGDPNATNRWLSVHEMPAVALLRSLRPRIWADGLSAADREALERILA